MPFTPFHLGPALLIGLLLPLNLAVLLVSSVILDIEPFYSMFISPRGYLHGVFHSYLGATVVGLVVAFMFKVSGRSFRRVLPASIVGVYSHVSLDSFLYLDMKPFYPLHTNPLYMAVSQGDVYFFCAIAFLPAFIIGIYKTKI